MKRKIKRTVKLIIMSSIILNLNLNLNLCTSYADSLPPMIVHSPVASFMYGPDLRISCVVVDNDDLSKIALYYRENSEKPYQVLELSPAGRTFEFVILKENLAPTFEYYIETVDKSGNVAYAPKDSPRDKPYQVTIHGAPFVAPPGEEKEPKFKPRGSYSITFQKAEPSYPTGPADPPDELIAIQPGGRVNYNMSGVEQAKYSSTTFWFNRDTELYTGRTYDKFRLAYNQPTRVLTAGDFYEKISDLSLAGRDVTGISLKSILKKNNYEILVGRSRRARVESASSTPVFRQIVAQVHQELDLGGDWTLGGNVAYSEDVKSSIPAPSASTTAVGNCLSAVCPTENVLTTVSAKKMFSKTMYFLAENAMNSYDDETRDAVKNVKDNAYRAGIYSETDVLTWKAYFQEVGKNFFSLGSLEADMENDKKGFYGYLTYQPESFYGLSSYVDVYRDNLNNDLSTTTDTTVLNGSVNFNLGDTTLTPNYSRTRRKGENTSFVDSDSKTKGVSLYERLSGYGVLGATTLLANYQTIAYVDTVNKLNLDIELFIFSFDTAFKDLFTVSTGYNRTDTVELQTAPAPKTRRETYSWGLTYNLIPAKYSVTGAYQLVKNNKSDATIGNWEKTASLTYNYNLNPSHSVSIAGRFVQYRDLKDTDNHYDESVVSLKFMRSF